MKYYLFTTKETPFRNIRIAVYLSGADKSCKDSQKVFYLNKSHELWIGTKYYDISKMPNHWENLRYKLSNANRPDIMHEKMSFFRAHRNILKQIYYACQNGELAFLKSVLKCRSEFNAIL